MLICLFLPLAQSNSQEMANEYFSARLPVCLSDSRTVDLSSVHSVINVYLYCPSLYTLFKASFFYSEMSYLSDSLNNLNAFKRYVFLKC